MEIKVQNGDILQAESDLAVLATFEDAPLPLRWRACSSRTTIAAGPTRPCCSTRAARWLPAACCWSAWASEKATAETIRRASATAVKEAQKLQVAAITVGVHGDLPLAREQAAQAFAEGLELGAYRYWHYRTGLSDEQTFDVKAATVFTHDR